MTFEAGWNAAIEKAAAKVDNLKAHLNMEEFLLVLRDKPKAAEIAKAVCSILDANAAAIRSLTLPSDLVAVPNSPDDLRAAGLTVAVHNDYRLNGEAHTFWLMVRKDGMSFKGEGKTDAEALNQIRAMLAAHKEG